MHIKDVQFIPVRVPRTTGWRSALGAHSFGDAAIVLVRCDQEDAIGIGEVSCIWDSYASGLVAGYGQKLKDAVIGLDLFGVTELHRRMDKAVCWSKAANCIKAGVEMAVYDLIGKLKDMPVYNLLGGKNREKVPVSKSIGMGTVEDQLESIAYQISLGYKTMKIKSGLNIEGDLKTIGAVRKKYGDRVAIRIDGNMGWRSPKMVLELSEKLHELGVISIEQPLPPDDIEGLAFLRTHSPIAIMADESVWSPVDALRIIRAGAADIMNVYVSEAGGLYNAMLMANMCHVAGVGFCLGSMPELGIGTAAVLHLAFAAPQIDHPSDVVGNTCFQDDVIAETLPVRDGFAYPIDMPGLGVSLDWDKVNKYRTDNVRT